MTVKKMSNDKRLAAKAREVLEFAERRAKKAKDWLEVHRGLLDMTSKLFVTPAERTAFYRTKEYRRILALLNRLPYPDVDESKLPVVSFNATDNTTMSVPADLGPGRARADREKTRRVIPFGSPAGRLPWVCFLDLTHLF